MSDVSAIASAMIAMSQAKTQDQISLSMIKMNAEAEQAVADMLLQNARQIQALANSSQSIIDLICLILLTLKTSSINSSCISFWSVL